MAEVTFQHIKHYVYVMLSLAAGDAPIHNTYPNAHMRWHGDTLQIIPDGANLPKASYHRSVVMVAEEHGQAAGQPPNSPVRTAIAPPIPDAEQTQVMTPVPAPAVESAVERMERIVRDLPVPTMEGNQNDGQGAAGSRRGYRASGEAARTSADRAEAGTSVVFAKEKDKDFEKEQDDEIAKLRPQTPPPAPKPDPKPNGFFNEAQSGSAINQTSDSPKVSGWQALKQMVLGKSSDEPEITLGREQRSSKSQSGNSHRRVGGNHRANYFRGYTTGWKRYARRALARPTVRAAVLAFVMFNAPVPVYVEN